MNFGQNCEIHQESDRGILNVSKRVASVDFRFLLVTHPERLLQVNVFLPKVFLASCSTVADVATITDFANIADIATIAK